MNHCQDRPRYFGKREKPAAYIPLSEDRTGAPYPVNRIYVEELEPEQLQFLAEGYFKVFRYVRRNAMRLLRKEFPAGYNEPRNLNGEEILSSVGSAVGETLLNTAVSLISGVDSFFTFDSNQQSLSEHFKTCSMHKLRYLCLKDQEKGLGKLLDLLESTKQKPVCRAADAICAWENDLARCESYEKADLDYLIITLLAPGDGENGIRLLRHTGKIASRALHSERHGTLGYDYDFIQGLWEVHQEYDRRWPS